MRRLLLASGGLLLVAPLLAGCGEETRLARELAERTGSASTSLYLPLVDGELPTSWVLNIDGSVTLAWKRDGAGFDGTLTLREGDAGDLCRGRLPDWDRCVKVDTDAVALGFEEQNAVAVRLGADELFWSNFSLEAPDESFPDTQAMLDWQQEQIARLVAAARAAEGLTPEEFVDLLPQGKVATG